MALQLTIDCLFDKIIEKLENDNLEWFMKKSGKRSDCFRDPFTGTLPGFGYFLRYKDSKIFLDQSLQPNQKKQLCSILPNCDIFVENLKKGKNLYDTDDGEKLTNFFAAFLFSLTDENVKDFIRLSPGTAVRILIFFNFYQDQNTCQNCKISVSSIETIEKWRSRCECEKERSCLEKNGIHYDVIAQNDRLLFFLGILVRYVNYHPHALNPELVRYIKPGKCLSS